MGSMTVTGRNIDTFAAATPTPVVDIRRRSRSRRVSGTRESSLRVSFRPAKSASKCVRVKAQSRILALLARITEALAVEVQERTNSSSRRHDLATCPDQAHTLVWAWSSQQRDCAYAGYRAVYAASPRASVRGFADCPFVVVQTFSTRPKGRDLRELDDAR